jgi:hypothetical protein
MARNSKNPIQEHHRKQRQKQNQKNKQQRSKARDEKVVQTKSVTSVKEEIRVLERKKENNPVLQPGEEQKLQRLRKELKLVQEAAAAADATNNRISTTTSQQQQQQQFLTELDDPRKSVHYDERFNPYGAPPPGKPRLYHQRGGGVTMDIRMAIVPGQEVVENELKPPPPPPPPKRPTPPSFISENQFTKMPPLTGKGTDQASQDCIQIQTLDSVPPPPLPQTTTLRLRNQTLDKKDCTSIEDHKDDATGQRVTTTIATKGQTLSNNTNGVIPIPSLPSASQAVQRVLKRRRKQKDTTSTNTITIDIWASQEEVEYERSVNQIDVEADDWGNNNSSSSQQRKKRKKTKSIVPLEYYYQDQNGQVQGPFAKDQMRGWIEAGYFPLDSTLVKTSRNESWVSLREVPSLQLDPLTKHHNISVDSCSIQDRIAALKEGLQSGCSLSSQHSTIEDRIASLKRPDRPAREDDNNSKTTTTTTTKQEEQRDNVTSDVAGNKNQAVAAATTTPLPMENEERHVVDADSNVGMAMTAALYSVAPYTTNQQYHDKIEVVTKYFPLAPYPMGDDTAISDYPVDETGDTMAAYPIDESYPADDHVAYPVTDTYHQVEEEPGGVDYGSPPPQQQEQEVEDVVAYPPGEGSTVVEHQKKKSIKVDSQVVAFLPSHLQKKKRNAPAMDIGTTPATQRFKQRREATSTTKNSGVKVNDDYDKFMQEIEGIDESSVFTSNPP